MVDRRVLVSLAVLSSLAMPVAQGAPMSLADLRSDRARIGADFATARTACARQTGNAARVCMEEAHAAQRLARAELAYRYSGKLADQRHIVVVAANNAYALARLKCADQALGNRDVCAQQARSELSKALADPGRVWP